MKKNRILTMALAAIVLFLVVAVVALTTTPLKPSVRTVEQNLPNDQIPR